MKKDFITMMLKKYNCQSVKVVSKIDENFAGAISNKECRIIFDIENSEDKRYLVIEDIISKDNIHLYYEFMSEDDLEKYNSFIDDILKDRIIKIHTSLDIDFLEFIDNCIVASFFEDSYISFISFGVKDILKPIEEYIKEIKESEQYKEYMSKKVA